ncbi:DNA-binding protein [Comamonas testosteroni]|uniref:DNA-binding protein n=1 Tax=Comamonas testosteroni TaxID=285 RepID=UPI002E164AE7|nr:DNA-binding protein [Comamonas testosteroni]
MNDDEKNFKTKTKATKQAVFDFCDSLAAQGFSGDFYKEVAERFNAGNGTIAPHIKAWQAGRPKAGGWVMTEAAQAIAEEFIQKIWGATCTLAQSKLAVSSNTIS